MFIMKKKTIANLIMVLTIALFVAVGALIAWCLRPVEESVYGAQFHREEIKFPNISDLKECVAYDIRYAKRYFG